MTWPKTKNIASNRVDGTVEETRALVQTHHTIYNAWRKGPATTWSGLKPKQHNTRRVKVLDFAATIFFKIKFFNLRLHRHLRRWHNSITKNLNFFFLYLYFYKWVIVIIIINTVGFINGHFWGIYILYIQSTNVTKCMLLSIVFFLSYTSHSGQHSNLALFMWGSCHKIWVKGN